MEEKEKVIAGVTLRPGTADDGRDIVRLNDATVAVTSPMNMRDFHELFKLSSLLIVAERDEAVVGFLMGFTEGVDLEGLNYRWFDARLRQYLYIDRIVVDESCRGSGLGREIYAQVEAWAQAEGLVWLAAEMDLDPPNVGSLRFHKRSGFVEVGIQKLPSGKVVSMQIKAID